jgi:hypothetical protein
VDVHELACFLRPVILMQFRAEEYFQASLERMRQAVIIYRDGKSFALAMYCGGLAVECLLRAFRWSKDPAFEGRHDLSDLLKSSGLLRVDEEYLQRRRASEDTIREASLAIRSAMNEIISLWHNNLRFASEASLRAYLKRIGRLQGSKGNALKKNAKDLIGAAQSVVNRGVTLWTSKKRS